MDAPPRPDEVAQTWMSRVCAGHLTECELWQEFRRVYRRKARREWLRFCRRDVPEMLVAYAPDWCRNVKGVG